MRAEIFAVVSSALLFGAAAVGCSGHPAPAQDRLPVPDGRTDGAGDSGTMVGGEALPSSSVPDAAALGGPLLLFVGSGDGKVRVYDVDPASGALTFKKASSAGKNPSFLAFDPSRRRVVAVDEIAEMGQVRSFAFDSSTGALTEIAAEPAGGADSTHVSLDPTGKWVFVANYTGGNVSVLPLDPSGTLAGASDQKVSGAKSHWAGTNPSGTHLFVSALQANVIAQYTFDARTGKLTTNGVAAPPTNAGPRHLTFLPNEARAYVINEKAVTVTAFDFDKATGKLTPKASVSALPDGQTASAGVTGAEIAVHPSGLHLYASTRGYNSIAHFTVDPADGALTLVANTPTGGKQPRSFGMSPDGTLLYAGNQSANKVVGFRIVAATGALEPLGVPLDVPSPTFVGFTRMPAGPSH